MRAASVLNFPRFLIFAVMLIASLQAQAFGEADGSQPINTNPLTAKFRFQPSEVEPGGTAELLIDVSLADSYRAYVDKFKVSFENPQDLKVGDLKAGPIVQFLDSVSKKMKDGIQKEGQIKTIVEVPQGFAIGQLETKLKLTYQACTDEHCLFPKTIELKAPLRIIASTGQSKLTPAGGGASMSAQNMRPLPGTKELPQDDFTKALGQGTFMAILLLFGMGFLTSLTPCIYPMIPITLAVLGARTKGQSKFKSFTLSFTYVLGIAVTYSILGVAAAKTGALFGAALANVYVVTAIGLLFVAMGLSMYGLFELQVPAFLRNSVGTAQTGSGYGGAFGTGLIAGVVASPCVGPVLVSVLTYIAQTQNLVLGFSLLFSFAMGLGVLFMVLGTSSALLSKLPKAGSWMDATKFIFGTLMIAMALYYVQPIYPKWLFHSLLGLAAILVASAYGAFEPNEKLEGAGRLRKGAMLATFVIGLAFALSGLAEKAGLGFAQGGLVAGNANSYQKLDWKPYSDESLQAALSSGKPVLIDFYADWCGACKELEKDTFTDSRIRDLSEQFALLKIDATDDFPGLDKLRATYNVKGLPTMVFYDKDGKIRPELTVTGFEDADTFLKRMQTAVASRPTPETNSISQSSVGN